MENKQIKETEYERTWLIEKENMPNFFDHKLHWGRNKPAFRIWTQVDKLNEVRYSAKMKESGMYFENMLKMTDKNDPTVRKETKREITRDEFNTKIKVALGADKIIGIPLDECDLSMIPKEKSDIWMPYFETDKDKRKYLYFNQREYADGTEIFLVEVEFKSAAFANAFKAPSLFGREITHDPSYRGKILAVNHFKQSMSALDRMYNGIIR